MAGITNSIVVVNFNGKVALLSMLKAMRLNEATSTEFIIVDNASSDGSVQEIQEDFPTVKFVSLPSNRGFFAAANKGIDQAEADTVCLCHADVMTDVHTLAELSDQAREAGARKVAVMVPRVLGVDGVDQPSVGVLPSLSSAVAGAFYPPAGLKCRAPLLDHLPENEWTRFVCVAINRDVLGPIAAFDERFFLYCGDTDMCRRIHEKRLRVLFSKDVAVTHGGAALGKQIPDHLYRILRNDQNRYADKYLPGWQRPILQAAVGIGSLFSKST